MQPSQESVVWGAYAGGDPASVQQLLDILYCFLQKAIKTWLIGANYD